MRTIERRFEANLFCIRVAFTVTAVLSQHALILPLLLLRTKLIFVYINLLYIARRLHIMIDHCIVLGCVDLGVNLLWIDVYRIILKIVHDKYALAIIISIHLSSIMVIFQIDFITYVQILDI